MTNLYENKMDSYLEELAKQNNRMKELEHLFQRQPTKEEVQDYFSNYQLAYPYYYYIEAIKRSGRLDPNTQDNVNAYYYDNDIYYKIHPTYMSNTWIGNDLTDKEKDAELNPQIIEYVDSKLPKDLTDTLEKAIAIYILLGDIVRYDTKYFRHKDYSKLDSIDKIDLSNNEIICRSGAIMYHKLLSHYQIPSTIYGEGHLSVILPYEKALYDIDGFAFGQDEILSDVARIKFRLKIESIKVIEVASLNEEEEYYKQRKVEEKKEKVYKRLERKFVSEESFVKRLEKISEILKNTSKGNIQEEINRRINILNWFYRLPLGETMSYERYQMLKKYDAFLFQDFPSAAIHKTSIWEPTSTDLHIRRVIKIRDSQNENYFFIQRQNEFAKFTPQQLNDYFQEGLFIARYEEQLNQFFELPKNRAKKMNKGKIKG